MWRRQTMSFLLGEKHKTKIRNRCGKDSHLYEQQRNDYDTINHKD